MILPKCCRFMIGKACFMVKKGATSITFNSSSNFSVGKLSIGSMCCSPALLIKMSSLPYCSTVLSIAFFMACSLVTSQAMPLALPVLVLISFAAEIVFSSSRSVSTTLIPFCTKHRAISKPMPPAAPVINATCFSDRSLSVI